MTIDEVLEGLYDEKIGFNDAKQALLKIIKGLSPTKKANQEVSEYYSGFNQGVEATMKAITELFNREV